MFSGVLKSGSPSAKSRTSIPFDFSFLASAPIASVADGAIKLERVARSSGMTRPFSFQVSKTDSMKSFDSRKGYSSAAPYGPTRPNRRLDATGRLPEYRDDHLIRM